PLTVLHLGEAALRGTELVTASLKLGELVPSFAVGQRGVGLGAYRADLDAPDRLARVCSYHSAANGRSAWLLISRWRSLIRRARCACPRGGGRGRRRRLLRVEGGGHQKQERRAEPGD